MVRSPKSGRELETATSYTGPKWLADFLVRYSGKRSLDPPTE